MKCINKSHPDFKRLVEQTGKSVFELEMFTQVWQTTNNTDDFPTFSDIQESVFDTESGTISDISTPHNIEAVNILFSNTPALEEVGSTQEYLAYLSTKVSKETHDKILYHGGYKKGTIEKFDNKFIGKGFGNSSDPNFYFTEKVDLAEQYTKSLLDTEKELLI